MKAATASGTLLMICPALVIAVVTQPSMAADGDGHAVYAQDGDVYVCFVESTPQRVYDGLAAMEHASWSIDGLYIYAITSNGVIYRMYNDGSSVETGAANTADVILDTGSSSDKCPITAWRADPEYVFYVAGNSFSVISAHTGAIVQSCTADRSFRGEFGIDSAGSHVAGRATDDNLYAFTFVDGGSNSATGSPYDGGCSGGVSPSGNYMTANQEGHTAMKIYSWNGGSITVNTDSGDMWDNQRFAVNSNDWVVYKYDGQGGIGIVKRSTSPDSHQNRHVCDVPGLYGEAHPDYWVGASLPTPSSPTTNPPSVMTNRQSDVTTTSAQLNGLIDSTGGEDPWVEIHWGRSDAGTSGWANSEVFGYRGAGEFSVDVSELTPDTTYFVRAYATNSAGDDWGNTLSFNTLPGSPPADSYQQDSGNEGIVSLEAEHANCLVARDGHEWTFTSANTGFSASGAMEATPNSGTNNTTAYTMSSPEFQFSINFVKTGTHYVWVRGIGDSDRGSSNDSCHIGLDGATVSTGEQIYPFNSTWTWANTAIDGGVRSIDVASTGTHTLNLWMREDGLIVDKILLTTSPTYTPTGEGPSESPSGGAVQTPPNAVGDSATTAAATAVIIDVLANDSDPDGDPLSVVSLTQPTNGTASVSAANTIAYVPDSGFAGTDTFVYTVSDGQDASSAQVSVLVSSIDPSIDAPSDVEILSLSENAVELIWRDNSIGETGFTVFRDSGAGFVALGSTTFPVFTDDTVVAGTTYSYFVVAYSYAGESTPSSTTTVVAENPYVLLTTLNGGETVFLGQTLDITWVSNLPSFDAQILISLDNGVSWDVILQSWYPNISPFPWVVGNDYAGAALTAEEATECIIRIQHYETSLGVRDTSDSTFTIAVAHPLPGSGSTGLACTGGAHGASPLPFALLLAAAVLWGLRRKAASPCKPALRCVI